MPLDAESSKFHLHINHDGKVVVCADHKSEVTEYARGLLIGIFGRALTVSDGAERLEKMEVTDILDEKLLGEFGECH